MIEAPPVIQESTTPAAEFRSRGGSLGRMGWLEMLAWGGLIGAVNLPLLVGGDTGLFAFHPQLAKVQWWRWVTHPLAHVSTYHFLLDAGTFAMLFPLVNGSARSRFLLFLILTIGSLAGAAGSGVDLNLTGFGGLSGVGHGLAIYLALAMAGKNTGRRPIGMGLAAIVFAKCIWEVMTGGVFLSALHGGPVGEPLVGCHLGGALAGLGAWTWVNILTRKSPHLGK